MIFDWDENKEKLNIKNHGGIDFDEASRAVQDYFALEEFDDVHSTADEKRYACIGGSENRVLYVVYTIRNEEILSNHFGAISRTAGKRKL